ncbi:hypothetical protein ZIOFF_032991 [Zingiber officinale]|uniref:Uncharacterized protein n=1 Tax=Zingiber officinale TaxID=94328 RepID=A0A8J5GNI0_ZINOF|nr:hypothetical protein ZIOFF_032991 [Zingiber officinale]
MPTEKSPNVSSDEASKKASSFAERLAVRFIWRPLSADGEIAVALLHLCASPIMDAQEPPTLRCLRILYQKLTFGFKAGSRVCSSFLSLCGGEESVVPEAVLSLTQHKLR